LRLTSFSAIANMNERYFQTLLLCGDRNEVCNHADVHIP
jgi:hypothetical protein